MALRISLRIDLNFFGNSFTNGFKCLALPARKEMRGSTASVGALGPAACSPTSLLSGVALGMAGSVSARVASFSHTKTTLFYSENFFRMASRMASKNFFGNSFGNGF